MICAALTEDSAEAMSELAANTECDLVELRLDCLKDACDLSALSRIRKKKIMTCMPSWEGGRFEGGEQERIGMLEKALEFADYATIELNTEDEIRNGFVERARGKKVKVIVAHHDFKKTPSPDEIDAIIEKEKQAGADIAKIAFTPRSQEDVLNTLHPLSTRKDIPLITISMGEQGKVTRILAPLLGSYLTYGFPEGRAQAAPGQLSVGELKNILGNLR
ncbi:MAG: type I 3-dehydroquinate dehydratase [Candidatus Altiarchaeota archaeon]